MSDEILVPPDEKCADCGLPYGDPIHMGDADVEDERRERIEFQRAVSRRVSEKLAEHRYVEALVAWKMAQARGDKSVPRPRSARTDAEEMALIEARDLQARVDARVAQKIQEARGDKAEFVRVPAHVAQAKSDPIVFETRDVGIIATKDGPIG